MYREFVAILPPRMRARALAIRPVSRHHHNVVPSTVSYFIVYDAVSTCSVAAVTYSVRVSKFTVTIAQRVSLLYYIYVYTHKTVYGENFEGDRASCSGNYILACIELQCSSWKLNG